MKTPSQVDSEISDTVEQRREKNREAAKRYREKDRERFNQRMRDWRAANRDKAREHAREWRNRRLREGTPEEVAAIRAAESAKTKLNQDRCREQVFAAYGGWKCTCCGETEKLFLSIDHIENNGAAERRAGLYKGGGSAFYAWLRKQNFPPGYQVFCMNCQVGKHKNGGVCPHNRKV